MSERFKITESYTTGDFDNESWSAIVAHICPVKGDIELTARLGKTITAQSTVTCEACGQSTIVAKNLNRTEIIYLAEE